jgi:hypothetical protein
MADFARAFARRTRLRGGGELTAILAGSPPGVLSMTGGFPNPATFPSELDEIVARLVREDAAVALQYTPCAGLASVREYLIDRQERLQGRRPERAELIVTSGGMECIALMCQALIDPGDTIAVEAPSYLGALMAFAGAEADTVAIAMDDDGLQVDALAERLAAGVRPKFLYVIPEYQNPTGRTLPLERRYELVGVCRRYGVLIFEDVAYRELSFDGTSLPSLWSLAPDVVLQAGTFSKSFFPGVRLGWAVGPSEVIAELSAAKQNNRPVRRRSRPAPGGGIWPRWELRAPPPGGPGAVRVALGGSVGGDEAAHARGGQLDAAHGRVSHLADPPGGARRARHAPGRHGSRRGLRPGDALLRRRQRRQHTAALLQPPDRE